MYAHRSGVRSVVKVSETTVVFRSSDPSTSHHVIARRYLVPLAR